MTTSLDRRAELPASERRPGTDGTPGAASTPAERGGSRLSGAASLVGMVVVLAGLTRYASAPLSNADTWFHLRIGEGLSHGWSLTHPGRLSSFGDVPWVPTQWSVELVAVRFESWFGLPGVAWFFGLLYLVMALVVHAVCRREAATLPATVATGACVLAASSAISARPQVVTLALLAVVVAGWLSAGRGGRLPYHLVPVTWVWATAHGMWSTGVVVSGVCAVGLLLDRRQQGTLTRRLAVTALAVPVLSVVAACVTPVGPRLLASQLAVGRRAPLLGEWAPTNFREADSLVLAAMVGVVVVCWARRGGASWMRLLLLLLATAWAMLVTRMVGCSAFLVAPLLAGALHDLLSGSESPAAPSARRGRHREAWVLAAVAAVSLGVLALAVPHTARVPADVPSGFGSRLAALPAGSSVVVEDGSGSWIEWRYRSLSPVIDGMVDAYPVDYVRRYLDFKQLRPGWETFLTDSGARVAVVLDGSPLAEAMQHQLGWHDVQRTGRWLYLTAPGPAAAASSSG